MDSKKAHILKNVIFCFLMVLVGIAISLSVKTVYLNTVQKKIDDGKKLEEYKEKIDELSSRIEVLKKSNEENSRIYTAQVTSLANVDSTFYNLLTQYHGNIEAAKEFAGLTPVEGEGITVTVSDSGETEDVYSGNIIVHDSTLMQLVNDLKTAGAKAISVNGERIVATTEFICVGPAVKVNGTKLFSPFVVKAVGNPAELTAGVKNGSLYANQKVTVLSSF